MKEEIIHKFESIFAKVIDTDQGNVELVPSPQVVLMVKTIIWLFDTFKVTIWFLSTIAEIGCGA